MKTFLFTSLTFLLFNFVYCQADLEYQVPPKAIEDLVNAPQTPAVSINPTNDWMVLLERPGFPTIEELAQPELRLAGLRINPRNNGPSRSYNYTGMNIKSIQGDEEYAIKGLPENPKIQNVNWAPNGQKIAFTLSNSNGIELWIADFNTGLAEKLTEAIINDISKTKYNRNYS